MATTRKMTIGVLAAAAAFALTMGASFAASQFAGVWKVKDSAGKDFEITLSEDGSASANRAAKPMKGKWAEDGGAAVVTWDTGWISKISKDGDKYTKTAYKKGAAADPKNSSDAVKVK